MTTAKKKPVCPLCRSKHQPKSQIGSNGCRCRICYNWVIAMGRKCVSVAGGVTVKERQRAIGIISQACGAAGDMADGLSFGTLKEIMKEIMGHFTAQAPTQEKRAAE